MGWPKDHIIPFLSGTLRYLVGALMLAFLVAGLTQAGEKPVQLAADHAWQPFIDPDRPGGGLVTDLVVSTFAAAEREAEVHFLTWSRVLQRTAEGEFDAIAGAYHSPARAKHFLYSDPFLRFRVSLLTRRDFPIREYETLGDLTGYRVGIIKDAAYPPELMQSGLTLHRSASREALVRMLRSGRIDLLADTEELFRHHALNIGLNPDEFVAVTPPLTDEALFVIAPRNLPGSRQLIDDFNRGLKTLKSNNRYLEIRRKHGF